MITGDSELSLLVIKTEENDERFSTSSRRLYRKNSIPHSSLEVYYGGASQSVAIPFGWEIQPGTPKVVFRETLLPPLTPPPSVLLDTPETRVRKHSRPKPWLLYTILLNLTFWRKSQSLVSPASSATYSSSLSPGSLLRSVPSSLYSQSVEIQLSSGKSSFESRRHSPKEDELDSPHSTLCFGIRRNTKSKSRGCSPRIRRALLGNS